MAAAMVGEDVQSRDGLLAHERWAVTEALAGKMENNGSSTNGSTNDRRRARNLGTIDAVR